MNVIGYVRVSTQGQVKDGYSLAYQHEEIVKYCATQGWTLMKVFSDAGVSGAKLDEDAMEIDRQGFQDLLDMLSTCKVDFVVVLQTNRLWRSDIVKALVHREFKKYSVDVRSIDQPTYSIYKKDPADFLINGLLELLDAYQRLEIAMKLGRGRNRKASEGKYAGGGIPFGYRAKRGSKALSVDQEQATIVRRLFELKEVYPEWTLTQYAEQMNVEGYRTGRGQPFTKVQVKRIFDRRDFYKGLYQYGGIEAEGQHAAII